MKVSRGTPPLFFKEKSGGGGITDRTVAQESRPRTRWPLHLRLEHLLPFLFFFFFRLPPLKTQDGRMISYRVCVFLCSYYTLVDNIRAIRGSARASYSVACGERRRRDSNEIFLISFSKTFFPRCFLYSMIATLFRHPFFFLPGEGELFRVDIFVKYPFPFLMKICVKNDQEKKGPFILKQLWRYSVVFIFLVKKKK